MCRRHEINIARKRCELSKSYREDGGRPTRVGCQEQALNHLKLLLLRAMVVSVEEKAILKSSGMD